MELKDFNRYKQTLGTFGGNAGKKAEIIYNDERWIVKYPQNTREMEGVLVSYANSPISEYIGSHIYQELGIPVHDTLLGERDGKIVVACKNFLERGDRLIEFGNIKNMYDPRTEEISNTDLSKGSSGGSDLFVTLEEIKTNVITSQIPEIQERFWDMFVIDALISNNDRNNGNWGIIEKQDGRLLLAPVYDNGNSFNNKMDLEKMKRVYSDERLMRDNSVNNVISFYTINNEKIHPFQFLKKENIPEELLRSIERYDEKVSLRKINNIIDEIPEHFNGKVVIHPEYKEYLKEAIKQRDNEFQEILKFHNREEYCYAYER